MRLFAAAAALLFAAACGRDYAPPSVPATGTPAAPLGRVFDVHVELPHLYVPADGRTGARFALTLTVAGAGEGSHDATFTAGTADVGGDAYRVEDLSNGKTALRENASAWASGRIGPLRLGGALFELLLDGAAADGGWSAAGTTWESQSGLNGTFSAARRHRFLVTATDFGTGGEIELVELGAAGVPSARTHLTETSPDPVLATAGGAVFVVNRLSYDNLQRLDPQQDYATAWQAGTGQGSNPQDALWLAAGKAYVTRFEPPYNDVAVIDPRGGALRGSIDLASLATNRDATPRAAALARAADTVFAALVNVDRTFTRYGPGRLAVIDAATDRLEMGIELPGKNPGALQLLADANGREKLYVALSGIYPGLLPQELSGGVAVVDVANRAFERWALDDDDAGGNIGPMALASRTLGYAVVSDATWTNRIVAFDPSAGTVRRTLAVTGDLVGALAVDSGGVLAIPDRSFDAPALCLYRVPTNEGAAETPLGCARLPLPPFAVRALD